jgi:RNA polymerase sigma-70 factor (ECF subfamily)
MREEGRRAGAERTDHWSRLLSQAQQDDRQAFETLMAETRPGLLRRARSILRDEGLANEVVTRVFAKAWRNRASYDRSQAAATTWLGGILRHEALTVVEARKQQQAREVTGFEVPSAGNEEGPARQDFADFVESAPPDEAEETLTQTLVHRALAALTPEEQHLIRLAYFDRSSNEEIAALLGITTTALATRLTRARRHLAEVLDPDLRG